ncbi:hypothetical protein BKA81DRAFT_406138 [Phyllosticta paracitricarpa]
MPPPLEAASAELVSTCGEITRISDFGCKDGVSDEPQGQVELENKKAMIACNESNDTPPNCGGSRREEACNTVNTTTTERPADDSDFRAEVKQLRLAQERQLEIITEQTLNIYKLNAEQSRQGSEIRQLKQELQASRQPPCGDKEKEGEEDDDVDQPLVRTLAKLLYCMDKLFEHIFTRRMRTSDRFLSDIRVELGDERYEMYLQVGKLICEGDLGRQDWG